MAFLADVVTWAGIVGAIASVLAVIVTVVIAYRSRRKKSFSYEIISENPLISVDDEIKGKLKLLYEDSPIENVHLLLVRFANSGNIPIPAGDYERPLTMRFKEGTTILSAEYAKPTPDSLKIELKVEDNVVSVTPVLMNGGDSFTAKMLLGQYRGAFDVDARIVGVNSLRALRRQPQIESNFFRDIFSPTGLSLAGLTALLAIGIFLFWSAKLFDTRDDAVKVQVENFTNTIFSPPSIVELGPVTPKEIRVGELIRIRAVVRGGTNLYFKWEVITNGRIIGDGGETITFTPDRAGTAEIMLTVIDKNGAVTSRKLTVPVLPPPTRPKIKGKSIESALIPPN